MRFRIVYISTLLFLIGLLFSACKKQNEIVYNVPEVFSTYVERFKQEAKLRGYQIDFEKTGLIVEFQNTGSIIPHAVGICYFSHEGSTPKIGISETFWNSVGDETKELTIFHELGHCALNRDHRNDTLANGHWASILRGYPEEPGDHPLDYNRNRSYYIDELFDPATPLLRNPPKIEMSYPNNSPLIHYDILNLGLSQSKNVIMKNIGEDTLIIHSVQLCNQFSTNFLPTILLPNTQKILSIHFSPTTLGIHTCFALINSNDPDHPQISLTLKGIGVENTSNWVQLDNFKAYPFSNTLSIGNKGYVIDLNSKVWEYNPNSDQWLQKNNFPSNGRSRATTFTINGKGYLTLGGNLKELWEYTPQTDRWTRKADFPSMGRIGAAGFVLNQKAYVAGRIDPNTSNHYKDCWEYDPLNDTWTPKQNLIAPFDQGVSFALNGKGYVGLGITNDSLYEYNPILDQWIAKTQYMNASHLNSTAFVINNIAYIGTGTDANNIDSKEFWQYSNNTWQRITDFPIEKLATASFVTTNKAYLGGGYISSYGLVYDFWEFTP